MSKTIKRVLVVDDEEDLTWSISKNLAKDKNVYDLICVNSGKDALNVLNQVPVDLVVSDIKMPEITGLDLLITIKEEFPKTKVIIMTAYGSESIQKEVFRRGSIAYIEKPFEIESLRSLIKKNLEEQKGFKGEVSDFQLTDIIQMNCLGRLTTALNVKKGSEEGMIFFEEGNIIHAEVSGTEGEEAFYEILGWKGGEFTSRKGDRTKKETIFKGWQSLLLEALKRSDEDVPVRDAGLSSNKQYRIEKLEELLSKIGDRRGVQIVAIFDRQGFALASHVNIKGIVDVEISDLMGMGGELIEAFEKLSTDYTLGSIKFVSVEFKDNNMHIFSSSNKDYFLIVLTTARTNDGAIRLIVKKMMPELVTYL